VLRLEREWVAICCKKKIHKEKGEMKDGERRVDHQVIN
jgi:hypothetical protein